MASPDVPMWNPNALTPQNTQYFPAPGTYPYMQMGVQPASLDPMKGLNLFAVLMDQINAQNTTTMNGVNPITPIMDQINAQNFDPMAAFRGSAPEGSMNLSGMMNPLDPPGALDTLDLGNRGGGPSAWKKFRDSFVGTKDEPGWGGLAIGGANSLLQGYLGMRQYALGKKQLSEDRRQFNLNYEAQKKTTNSALEDRQRARVASGNSNYESVDSYMKKYGI